MKPNMTMPIEFEEGSVVAEAQPFLRWPGGKTQILKEIGERLPSVKRAYHEPFLGGGSVFFEFGHLFPDKPTLGDLNPELIEVYRVVRDEPEALIKLLKGHADLHRVDENHYYHVRAMKRIDIDSMLKRAARFAYLNKACWNGLYRVNKRGEFNVPKSHEDPYKNLTETMPMKIRGASRVLQRATLRTGEYKHNVSPQQNDFVYCDPPYTTTENGFDRYQPGDFKQEKQEALAKWVRKLTKQEVFVMVSNADLPEIVELYEGLNIEHITAVNTITWKKKTERKEILVTNF